MARNQAVEVDNNFSKGLITENTALSFPKDACTETLNCVFDETGRVTRRKPLDIEEGFIHQSAITSTDHDDVCTEFLWTNVAGLGTLTFVVQQTGDRIYIFDCSSSTSVSANVLFQFSLSTFKTSGTPYSPRNNLCQFAQGNGDLIVTNKACEPFYISYDKTLVTFAVRFITVQYRDFIGLDDSYAARTRPIFATMADMVNNTQGAMHFYNLLNQGWWQGGQSGGLPTATSALGQWDTAFGNFPSHNDAVSFFRASPSDALDPARVGAYDQGNTPAPKGHFLLTVGNADRYTALTTEGYSLTFSSTTETYIDNDVGSIFGQENATERGYLFDDNVSGASSSTYVATSTGFPITSLTTYAGKSWGTAKEMSRVVVYSGKVYKSGVGTTWQFGTYNDTVSGNDLGTSVVINVYGSNTLPTAYNDGTLIGTKTVAPNSSSTSISCTAGTPYLYTWVALVKTFSSAPNVVRITLLMSEIKFYETVTVSASGSLPAADKTFERFQSCAFFASRAWYAGLEEVGLSNNIYYSQVIIDRNQYGRCYQKNDPTSEVAFDILPDDGGVIKIPEMGKVYKMFPYQSSLLIFASNGVWIIGSSNGFTATDFYVRKISSLGTGGSLSLIDIKGTPVWWGEEGIFQINYNPQFDSFSVENISENTIRTLFYSIPADRRNMVKGAYDIRDGVAYWLYNDSTDINTMDTLYTKALCLNIKSGAYYTMEFGQGTPLLCGILYVQDSIGIADPAIKIVVLRNINATQLRVYYADFKDRSTYTDWLDYSTQVSLQPTDAVTYNSYFITGYKLNGETMKYVQPNYVMVFLEAEDSAGCFLQGVYDFTNSGNSGKWSSRQQCYNPAAVYRDIISRRLKVRGKGRSVQYKFSNDGSKPFTIIGWSTFQTANRDL